MSIPLLQNLTQQKINFESRLYVYYVPTLQNSYTEKRLNFSPTQLYMYVNSGRYRSPTVHRYASLTYETEFVLFLARLVNSVLPIG